MEDNIELQAPEVVTYMNMIDYKNKYDVAKEMYDYYKSSFEKWVHKEYGICLEDNCYKIECNGMGKYYLKVV